jgi:hypothetical protein
MSMNLMKSLRTAALAVMVFSAGVANATLLNFSLTGDYTASWQLDSTAKPDGSSTGQGFVFNDVEGTFPGSLFNMADLTFYNDNQGGGLQIYDWWNDEVLLVSDGIQLYTGKESSPVFKLGTFKLTEFDGSGLYTLTVSNAEAVAVPEPATGAILLGGLGLMYLIRKRRHTI